MKGNKSSRIIFTIVTLLSSFNQYVETQIQEAKTKNLSSPFHILILSIPDFKADIDKVFLLYLIQFSG